MYFVKGLNSRSPRDNFCINDTACPWGLQYAPQAPRTNTAVE